MIYDEDMFKWIDHTLSLKTELGVRNSLKKLRQKIIDDKAKRAIVTEQVMNYQRSGLELLRNLCGHGHLEKMRFKDE
jgi:hypothetical protein